MNEFKEKLCDLRSLSLSIDDGVIDLRNLEDVYCRYFIDVLYGFGTVEKYMQNAKKVPVEWSYDLKTILLKELWEASTTVPFERVHDALYRYVKDQKQRTEDLMFIGSPVGKDFSFSNV